jgi:hypothetical protein
MNLIAAQTERETGTERATRQRGNGAMGQQLVRTKHPAANRRGTLNARKGRRVADCLFPFAFCPSNLFLQLKMIPLEKHNKSAHNRK